MMTHAYNHSVGLVLAAQLGHSEMVSQKVVHTTKGTALKTLKLILLCNHNIFFHF